MPWLDDLRANTDISSNRKLAAAMLKHESWPVGEQISVPALSNQLNSANRGERLDWWLEGRGRPFFGVLAAVLEITDVRLREAFSEAGGVPPDQSDVFRFDDLAGLPPLDLRREPLPRWVPGTLRRCYHATWWHAPSGSGRTLVGQWLQTNKGVVFLRAERWADVAGELPLEGTVYIELARPDGVPDVDAIDARHPDLSVMVACPEPATARFSGSHGQDDGASAEGGQSPLAYPAADQQARIDGDEDADESEEDGPRENEDTSQASQDPLGGWAEVRHGAGRYARAWETQVRDWVAQRLLPGGGLKLDQFWSAYTEGGLDEYVSTPGDLIQLMGLFDAVGTDRLLSEVGDGTGSRIVRAWWRSVCDRVERAMPDLLAPLKDAGPALVIETEAARLAQGLDACLVPESWAALLPARLVQPPVDARILDALQSGDASRRAQAIAALRQFDRDDFVAAMRHGGVLRPCAGGLRFGPRFVADLVRQGALSHLLEQQPSGLGRVLIDATGSGEAMDVLLDVAEQAEWAVLERAVKSLDTSTAEGAALLDGLVRAAGWAALQPDGPPVPTMLCRALWDAQQPLLITRWTGRLPQPVLQISRDAEGERPLTRAHIWPICRLGLSATLAAAGVSLPAAPDNPWDAPLDDSQREMLVVALSDAANILRTARGRFQNIVSLGPEEQTMLAVLGSRLYDQLGVLQNHWFLDDWQGATLICEAAAGRLAPEHDELASKAAMTSPFPLEAVEHVARLRGVPLQDVLEWASRGWTAEQWRGPLFEVPERPNFDPSMDLGVTRRLWETLRPERFNPTFCSALKRLESVWPWLSDGQWDVVLAQLKGEWWERHSEVPVGMLQHAPSGTIAALVREYVLTGHRGRFYGPVWEAHPSVLMALLPDVMAAPGPAVGSLSHLARLLAAAPDTHTEALVTLVRSWLEAPALAPGIDPWELRRWLAFVIEGRRPGWLVAWEVLRPGA